MNTTPIVSDVTVKPLETPYTSIDESQSESLQQPRPDIPQLLQQQVHARQLPPGAALAHPGLPGLPGLGPPAGLPAVTSASAALIGLGLTPVSTATPGTATTVHSLSMLGKPDIHRGQPDDLKSSGGKSSVCTDSGVYTSTLSLCSRAVALFMHRLSHTYRLRLRSLQQAEFARLFRKCRFLSLLLYESSTPFVSFDFSFFPEDS